MRRTKEEEEEEEDLFVFNDTIEGPSMRHRARKLSTRKRCQRGKRGGKYLIAHVLHYPLPHAHSFVLGPEVMNFIDRRRSPSVNRAP